MKTKKDDGQEKRRKNIWTRSWIELTLPGRVARVLLGAVAALLVIVICYLAYAISAYHRIPDNQELAVIAPQEAEASAMTTGVEYEVLSYNIGFGAYTPDFTFFMDGGTQSWAESKDSVLACVEGAALLMKEYDPDFVLFQEVDLDSTRSYHVNQNDMISEVFSDYYYDFAVNYDSPFLFYPLTQPHGKSKSGIGFYSKYEITSALRRSLPISTSFKKFVDLDRCYSISRVPVDNGKEVIFFTVHLSAYGNSDAIREGQLAMLREDMQTEIDAGNYVICGGDFNHDLKADVSVTDVAGWAYPLDRTKLAQGTTLCLDLLPAQEIAEMPDTTRNTDIPYTRGESYTVTVDGFIISDNVEMVEYETVDNGFLFSDHNPVRLVFRLAQ